MIMGKGGCVIKCKKRLKDVIIVEDLAGIVRVAMARVHI